MGKQIKLVPAEGYNCYKDLHHLLNTRSNICLHCSGIYERVYKMLKASVSCKLRSNRSSIINAILQSFPFCSRSNNDDRSHISTYKRFWIR